MNFQSYSDVLDKDCDSNKPRDLNLVRKHPLYSTATSFLETHSKEQKYVGVSLSGGVDSMVILYIFHVMGYKVVAIHIDYGNRKESGREAIFLEEWCKYLGIIFHKHNIDHISRGKIARDIYETETRQIRFKFYHAQIAQYGLSGIALGHHAGDITENVWTNIMTGKGIFDVSVMKPVSTIEGVNLWRPFLFHVKDDIFDFAQKFYIPYFKDTTPDWSNRGIVRRQLFPAVEKQYGPQFKEYLYRFGLESNEWYGIVYDKVLKPLFDKIVVGKFCTMLDFSGYEKYGEAFWTNVIMHVLYRSKLPMIPRKTILKIVENLESKIDTQMKNNATFSILNNTIYIYRTDVKWVTEMVKTGYAIGIEDITSTDVVKIVKFDVADGYFEYMVVGDEMPIGKDKPDIRIRKSFNIPLKIKEMLKFDGPKKIKSSGDSYSVKIYVDHGQL